MWSVVNTCIHSSKEFIQDCLPAKLINPRLLSLISPWTWKRPLYFLNRSTFHSSAKWKAGFLTVYICYLKIMKFWFNYNNFLGLAIIEVQLALFKISSTSNTKRYLAWLMLSWRKFKIKVVLHFGKPQNCVNILRKKLLADVVFVWEIKFRNKTTDAGIWLKGEGVHCLLFLKKHFFLHSMKQRRKLK